MCIEKCFEEIETILKIKGKEASRAKNKNMPMIITGKHPKYQSHS